MLVEGELRQIQNKLGKVVRLDLVPRAAKWKLCVISKLLIQWSGNKCLIVSKSVPWTGLSVYQCFSNACTASCEAVRAGWLSQNCLWDLQCEVCILDPVVVPYPASSSFPGPTPKASVSLTLKWKIPSNEYLRDAWVLEAVIISKHSSAL